VKKKGGGLLLGRFCLGSRWRCRCSYFGCGVATGACAFTFTFTFCCLQCGGLCTFVRSQHHDHVATVDSWFEFDLSDIGNFFGDAIQDLLAELWAVHLATSEHDGQLDLVTFSQEVSDLTGLRVEVARADLDSVFHFLDAEVLCFAAGLTGLLRSVELELAVVHDATHRRLGHGRDFDKVKVFVSSDVKGFRQRLYAELLTVFIDKSDLPSTNSIIDPWLVRGRCTGYAASLLRSYQGGCRAGDHRAASTGSPASGAPWEFKPDSGCFRMTGKARAAALLVPYWFCWVLGYTG
jgi:hypothetical protein